MIDFDDTSGPVFWNDYVAQGVASITETSIPGAGLAFARYTSTQSLPYYVGTGAAYEIGGANLGWDGTIQIDFALLSNRVGIGIANQQGGIETITAYDSSWTLLETYPVPAGINVYVGITRPNYDIARFVISGDFFAIDDLQFTQIPAPGAALLGLIGLGFVGRIRRWIS